VIKRVKQRKNMKASQREIERESAKEREKERKRASVREKMVPLYIYTCINIYKCI